MFADQKAILDRVEAEPAVLSRPDLLDVYGRLKEFGLNPGGAR